MTTEFLEILRCPSCTERFSPLHLIKVDSERTLYGIIQCRCSVYPVVDGILIFKNDDKTRRILRCVAKGETWKALKLSFDYRPDLNRILLATASGAGIGYRLLGYLLSVATLSKSRTDIPFFRLLDLAGKLRIQVFWTTYLKHRFSATSYWCSLPFIQFIDPASKYVLDVGCGTGIFSFIIGKRVPEEFIVCQNLEFTGLWLARKYFVPKANFICSDAGVSQPFPDETFDVVFSCDALQYVSNKEKVCEEVARLLTPHGLAILTHNHAPKLRDYPDQDGRGEFFDPETTRLLLERFGLKVMLFDEESVYQSNFPPVEFPPNGKVN